MSFRLARPATPRTRVLAIAAFLLVAVAGAQDARDGWQRPGEVLDALGVREGTVVADVGCGRGYFTAHLARRVGASGVVYAVDIDEESLGAVRRLVEREEFRQVRVVRGQPDDPRLPAEALDAALIVDTYHELTHPDAMLEKVFAALKPGGRLGIIDRTADPGEERRSYVRRHRIPEELVREEAARHGFHFVRKAEGFVRPRGNLALYFLIFQKPNGQD